MSLTPHIHGTVDMSSEVYWKLYRSQRNELVTVVCMQWFDEFDYYEDRFIVNSSGEVHVFDSEELAVEKLNEWYKEDEIDPEYRRKKRLENVRD